MDGILVVDLPPEEADELRRYTDPAGLAFITLIAPTTDPERARKILRGAAGFVYYISVTGVTGTAVPRPEDVRRDVERIKRMTALPVAVGFGISTPEQAAAIAPLADGVVVGSALVRLIGEKGEKRRPHPGGLLLCGKDPSGDRRRHDRRAIVDSFINSVADSDEGGKFPGKSHVADSDEGGNFRQVPHGRS